MIIVGFVLMFAVVLSVPFNANALSSERRKLTALGIEVALLALATVLIIAGGT